MKYIPIHKKTGVRYPAITEQERQNEWGRAPYNTHFSFEPVPDAPATKPASEPMEAKKAKAELDPAND